VVPDTEATSAEQLADILRVGRLLRGDQIDTTWTEVTLTVHTSNNLPPGDAEFCLLSETPLKVELDGRNLTLEMNRRVLYHAVRVADPAEITSVQSGDTIRLRPGSNSQARIATVPVNEP
jgi:hypothetical protein